MRIGKDTTNGNIIKAVDTELNEDLVYTFHNTSISTGFKPTKAKASTIIPLKEEEKK